jgi:hypothetical protein
MPKQATAQPWPWLSLFPFQPLVAFKRDSSDNTFLLFPWPYLAPT